MIEQMRTKTQELPLLYCGEKQAKISLPAQPPDQLPRYEPSQPLLWHRQQTPTNKSTRHLLRSHSHLHKPSPHNTKSKCSQQRLQGQPAMSNPSLPFHSESRCFLEASEHHI